MEQLDANRLEVKPAEGETLNRKQELVLHYLQPIQEYFRMEGVSEIMVNRYDTVFIERYGEKTRVDARWDSEFHLVTTIEQIANALGQAAHSEEAPILDARLQDGSRINATLAPIGVKGSNMTIRLFPKVRLTIENLLKTGSLTVEMAAYLKLAMLCEYNIVVAGSTGSGKTTLLNLLSNFIPDEARIISIEDTHELQLNKPHWVAQEAAKRQIEGKEKITMARLVEDSLRKNPDRIVIGEVRDASAAGAHMTSLNTGHKGILATIHANDAKDTIRRITNLVASSKPEIPYEIVREEVLSNIDLIVYAEKTPRHGRKIVEVAEVAEGELRLLWRWNYKQGAHEKIYDGITKLSMVAEKYGFDRRQSLI